MEQPTIGLSSMVKISAVIITFNEERNIGRCIDSLLTLADEILVVDSFSTDNTKAKCLARGVTFIENPFSSFGAQKNFAVSQATHDCVLSLDADEFLSEPLKKSLLAAKQSWPASAYSMNRLNKYGTKLIRHGSWYPDRKIRLWDRRRGKFVSESLHEYVSLDPDVRVQHLRGDIMHEAFMDVTMLMTKTQRYSNIYAEVHAHRKRSSPFKILARSRFAFFKSYFLKFGFLDGYEGFVIANSVANDVLYKYAKLYETNKSTPITLIITTHNRTDALELVLLSALRLSVMPEEIIVADDGPGPETRDLVALFVSRFNIPIRHCWHADNGFSVSTIRNKAIAMATQPYIVMVDDVMVLSGSFIEDHKATAWRGRLVQGSHVLLAGETTTDAIRNKTTRFSFFSPGITHRANMLRSGLMRRLFSYYSNNIYRVSGGNMAFWRSEAIAVNGFNEDFTSAGREDSEFVARMQFAGCRKCHLKFAGFAYQLAHTESRREALAENEQILADAVSHNLIRCKNGIDKYL
jgi:glycosyltransferase involved in cell wall biosynthesis